MADRLQLLRPQHRIKNGFVLAPLLFSGQATRISAVLRAPAAFGTFCLAASAAGTLALTAPGTGVLTISPT